MRHRYPTVVARSCRRGYCGQAVYSHGLFATVAWDPCHPSCCGGRRWM